MSNKKQIRITYLKSCGCLGLHSKQRKPISLAPVLKAKPCPK